MGEGRQQEDAAEDTQQGVPLRHLFGRCCVLAGGEGRRGRQTRKKEAWVSSGTIDGVGCREVGRLSLPSKVVMCRVGGTEVPLRARGPGGPLVGMSSGHGLAGLS